MSEPQTVGGRYELGELLGRGGMAEVRKGNDARLGRVVAVKRLRTDLASDPTFQARFRREAQSAAGLNHPSIVSVYDTGEEVSADGSHTQPYIVMEYVAGKTLRDILREDRRILPERALEITSGVLAALDYSHRAGIIHRDIKPANVMLTPSGDVKVMDFGIARAISDASQTMTQTAAVVGTAQYLSPEQARGETVDARSDVYSTGCLLYELLVSRPPFIGDSPVAVAYQHVREPAQPPSTFDPSLDPAIDRIVMKALAKRTEDRYSSAAAMRADIDRFLQGKPIDAPAVPDQATAVVPPVPTQQPTSIFTGPGVVEYDTPTKSRWPIVLLVLVVLALLGAGVAAGLQLFGDQADQTNVPSLDNLNRNDAEDRLERAGLVLGDVTREFDDEVEPGRVIDQNPDQGETVDEGTAVDIVLSSGSQTVPIPSVIDDDKDDAKAELEELGLRVQLEADEGAEGEADTVTRTDPEAGTTVELDSLVIVYFATGLVEVPDVTVLSPEAACARLESFDLVCEIEEVSDPDEVPNQVFEQDPAADTEVEAGTTVTIVVSTFVPPTTSAPPTTTSVPPPTSGPPAEEEQLAPDGE